MLRNRKKGEGSLSRVTTSSKEEVQLATLPLDRFVLGQLFEEAEERVLFLRLSRARAAVVAPPVWAGDGGSPGIAAAAVVVVVAIVVVGTLIIPLPRSGTRESIGGNATEHRVVWRLGLDVVAAWQGGRRVELGEVVLGAEGRVRELGHSVACGLLVRLGG